MNSFQLTKGNEIVYKGENDLIEKQLLSISHLFINQNSFVICADYINTHIAKFILRFNISTVINCSSISTEAKILLEKKGCLVIFNKIDNSLICKHDKFIYSFNLPLSEIVTLLSD